MKLPVPLTERAPEASVPVVERFSFPKEIDPLLSVILPSMVRFHVEPAALTVDEKAPVPVTERAPEASVPVVERFSSPKAVMAPLLSVMLPLASVRLPVDEAVAALIAPVKVPAPVTERAPEASVPQRDSHLRMR